MALFCEFSYYPSTCFKLLCVWYLTSNKLSHLTQWLLAANSACLFLVCLWGMWGGRQRECSQPSEPLLSHSCLLWPEHCLEQSREGRSPIACNELSITIITPFGFGCLVRGNCSWLYIAFPRWTAFVCLGSGETCRDQASSHRPRLVENCFSSVAQGVWSGVQPSSQVGSGSERVPNTIPRPTPFEHRQKPSSLVWGSLRTAFFLAHCWEAVLYLVTQSLG